MVGDVDEPGGRAGVFRGDAGDAGRREGAKGAALTGADQDHRQRHAGEVWRVGRKSAEPRHPDQRHRDAAGEQQPVAEPLGEPWDSDGHREVPRVELRAPATSN